MARKKDRPFACPVVSETVQIYLRRRPRGMSASDLMVQCDQDECQYVDANEPPCPLSLEMFAEEIREQGRQARRRREEKERMEGYE